MNFTFVGNRENPHFQWFAKGIQQALQKAGYQYEKEPVDNIRLVVNFLDETKIRPYRRKEQATFVVAVHEKTGVPERVLKEAYPILIQSLSNLLIYLVYDHDNLYTYFVTLEQGCYAVNYDFSKDEMYFQAVKERLVPLASSQLVINNEFLPDLPKELWEGDEHTYQIWKAGKKLDEMDLLPTPFPLEDVLSPRERRHIHKLFGIGGLSYGNLSARKDAQSFWMSASGVNKSNLKVIGQDILLVHDYDPERNVMQLRIPPHVQPHRVSVDAIEHWMIYRQHPQVGAIVHIHAWMEGVPATEINYPCGTRQLAQSVSQLVDQAEDPARAVIGLKNHGLTITGRDLDDIFERIDGKIEKQVVMS